MFSVGALEDKREEGTRRERMECVMALHWLTKHAEQLRIRSHDQMERGGHGECADCHDSDQLC